MKSMKRSKSIISKILLIIFIMTQAVIACPIAASSESGRQSARVRYEDRSYTEIIVKYKNDKERANTLDSVRQRMGLSRLQTKRAFSRSKIDLLEVEQGTDLKRVIQELNKDPNIEYAQYNYRLELLTVPADEKFGQQWGLSNTGQEVEGKIGRSGVDIDAISAWGLTQGSGEVLIGLLDTGVDITHQDLQDNIYINSGEIPDNGVDDDGNGFIDDVHGYDFANDDASVYDSAGYDYHGTFMAGIIAAKSDSAGITGVAPNVKILPLKFINGNAGYTCDAIEAIEYAMSMNVKIINCSFGGTDNNQALKDAMQNSGILFVCAGGNRGGDVASLPVYPACFELPNIISVAAIDNMGVLAGFSSYGASIDLAAPGINILGTTPDNSYEYMSGTSTSAASVTGVAALLKSYLPNISITEIKSRIKNNVRPCTSLTGFVASGGRLDAMAALTNTPKSADTYNGPGVGDDTLLVSGEGSEDTWYTQDQLLRIKERLHYGESGVNPGSGNYSFTCIDMSLPAPGFEVNISRTYNSRDEKTKPMGQGWSFGFEGSVTGRDLVEVKLPDGSVHRFRKNGSYYAPEDSRASFVKNADGTSVLTTKDQYSYEFNSDGWLYRMKDRNGNAITIDVDASGKISRVTDTVGREFIIEYNSDGLISNISDPEERKVTYEYDDNNRLIKVIDPMGWEMHYGYDDKGFLNSIKDHYMKPVLSLTYSHNAGDSQHKVISSTDSLGAVWNYSYDMTNRKTTITDGSGRKWTYWFDTSLYVTRVQDPEGRDEYTEYYLTNGKNVFGDVRARIDRNGNPTRYEIDSRGNVTRITNPDSGTKVFEYDEKNNIKSETDEMGRRTFYIYDASKTYLLKKVRPLNGTDEYEDGVSDPSNFAITTYTYYTRSEAYDLFGCNVSGLLKSVTDPEGNETKYTYNAFGDIETIEDPLKNITTYEYNDIGWKTAEISPRKFRTQYEYNDNGLLTKIVHDRGETTRIIYDMAGRKVKEVSPNQYAPEFDTGINTYTADVGTRYTYYDSGKLSSMKDAEGHITEYEYDVNGNLTKQINPDGSIYIYTYDVMDRLKEIWFKEDENSPQQLLYE